VTWDLDIPPENLLEPPKASPPPRDVPSIDKLRSSLMGTRFELLKISTFAAFLLSFVAVAVHGSHLTNPDNPFAANTSAALKALATSVSNQTASIRGKTEELALAATHKAEVALRRAPAAPVMVAHADVLTHGKHAARRHHGTHVAEPAIETVGLESQHFHRAHHHRASVEMASAQVPGASNAQWSGSLLDLPNFVTAEGSKAGQKILDVMQGGVELSNALQAHKGDRAMSSASRRADATATKHPASPESPSILDGMVSPDSLIAGMAALLLYTIFVFVLIQMKGGLRALSDSHAAV